MVNLIAALKFFFKIYLKKTELGEDVFLCSTCKRVQISRLSQDDSDRACRSKTSEPKSLEE